MTTVQSNNFFKNLLKNTINNKEIFKLLYFIDHLYKSLIFELC